MNTDKMIPIHAAMLAKFKEQGANTMTFTFENTKDATHLIGGEFKKIIPGNMPEHLKDNGEWVLSSFSVAWLLDKNGIIELSYPIGEREEDHTIDGILKKAQPQGAKAYEVALMIEALDDNPDEQVIEPWVVDHITDKPVFTQEMSEAGRMPKVGASIDVLNSSKHPMFVNVPVLYISKTMCVVDNFGVDEAFHPHKCYILAIDNRTDKDKLKDEIYKQIVTPHIPDTYLDDVIDSLVNAGKFTITLNK